MLFHCWTNFFWERLPIRAVSEEGQRDREERDEREQGRDDEHHRHHRHDGQQRGDELAQGLLEALGDVVDVVGDPAQQLASGLVVEVGQRQPVQLVLDVTAQPEDRPVDDPGEQVGLHPAEDRRHEVDPEDEEQDVPDGGEVDAEAGPDVVHRGEHVGHLALPGGPQALDGLGLGHPGGDALAEEPGEDEVGRPGEDLRADRVEHDACHGEHEHGDEPGALGAEGAQQPLRRGAEVLRLLGRHAHPHVRGAAHGARTGAAPGLGGLLLLGLDALAHAASSVACWDSTISR